MKMAPLAWLAFGVVLFAATVGWRWLWLVAGMALVALGALLFLMYRSNQFAGPRSLFLSSEEAEEAYPQFFVEQRGQGETADGIEAHSDRSESDL